MHRRTFLGLAGGSFAAAATQHAAVGDVPQAPFARLDNVEERVTAVLTAFDAQGNHRTGTAVDTASAQWLAGIARDLGVEPALEAFSLSRVDPQTCYLRIGDRRIDGVPLFDARFTGASGVTGRLGPIGSSRAIGVGETTAFNLAVPGGERSGAVAEAQRSKHQAVVLITRGSHTGLFLLNAPSFLSPVGPPMLQVSSIWSEWLLGKMRKAAPAEVVVDARRTPATAYNVTAKVAGRDPTLPPIVVMAPRSAWWQSVSEQGSRLVYWLEAMRAVQRARPQRDCLFVALTGHELGLLGIGDYLRRRPSLPRASHAWIFFGSSIGEPDQQNQIYASDDALKRWLIDALARERLRVDTEIPRERESRSEAGVVQKLGARVISVAGGTHVYHNPADRWPETVDVALIARYARGFADGIVELARD